MIIFIVCHLPRLFRLYKIDEQLFLFTILNTKGHHFIINLICFLARLLSVETLISMYKAQNDGTIAVTVIDGVNSC